MLAMHSVLGRMVPACQLAVALPGLVQQVAAMTTATALTFDRHGEPASALQLAEHSLPQLGEDDVQLEILAASAEHSCSMGAYQG